MSHREKLHPSLSLINSNCAFNMQSKMFAVFSSESIRILFLCLAEFQLDDSEHGKLFVVFSFLYCFGLSEWGEGALPPLTPEECAGYMTRCVCVCAAFKLSPSLVPLDDTAH